MIDKNTLSVPVRVDISKEMFEALKIQIMEYQNSYGNDFISEDDEFNPMEWSGENFVVCFGQGERQGAYDACNHILGIIESVVSVGDKVNGQDKKQ